MNKEELHADNRKLFEELDNKNPELLNKILSNVGNLMSFKDLADSSIGAFNNLINELIKNLLLIIIHRRHLIFSRCLTRIISLRHNRSLSFAHTMSMIG